MFKLKNLVAAILFVFVGTVALAGLNNTTTIPIETTAEGATGVAVFVQDQTTAPFFIKANNITNTTTLAAVTAIEDKSITVASDGGILVGDYLGLFSLDTDRFYIGTVLAKPGSNVLTMDTPLDSVFAIGDTVGTGVTNLAVNGAVTPVVFDIRGADPGINVTGDIVRIIMTCVDDAAVDLTKFCGGVALTNGLVMRRDDGVTINYINWKTNQDIAGSMYDWTVYSATNPQQGVDGFVSRLTFSRVGIVVRIAVGEELQFIVQDDLTGLTSFEIMVEGHVVQ